VRFEEMRNDLEGTVARCLDFLGKKTELPIIQAAVRNNSLDRMRAKEDQAKTLPKSPGEEGRWIGKGNVHGWREKLTERQCEIVDEFAADLLARLGYAGVVGDPKTPGVRVETCSAAGNTPRPPVCDSRAQRSLNRSPSGRIGGRIANLFSWYRY
jgi:hypothetical protein